MGSVFALIRSGAIVLSDMFVGESRWRIAIAKSAQNRARARGLVFMAILLAKTGERARF